MLGGLWLAALLKSNWDELYSWLTRRIIAKGAISSIATYGNRPPFDRRSA